jgi:hypothetical protein
MAAVARVRRDSRMDPQQATRMLANPGVTDPDELKAKRGRTLLRHSAFTHAAEDGANTSKPAVLQRAHLRRLTRPVCPRLTRCPGPPAGRL